MDPYYELELEKNCTEAEIKIAYRRLSKIHHPDVGGDAEKFARISSSATILRDPDKKKMYDAHGVILENGIDDMINSRLEEMFKSWIDAQLNSEREKSLDKHIKDVIEMNRHAIETKIGEIDDSIKKLKKMLKRITCADTENVIQKVIERKITELLGAKGSMETQKYIIDMLEKKGSLYSSYEEMNEVVKNKNRSGFFTGGFGENPWADPDVIFRKFNGA